MVLLIDDIELINRFESFLDKGSSVIDLGVVIKAQKIFDFEGIIKEKLNNEKGADSCKK